MATDNLASYGRMARFDMQRSTKIGPKTVLSAGGEMSDYHELLEWIRDSRLEAQNENLTPRGAKEWGTCLQRQCYYKRCRFDPFYNQFVMGGFNNDDTSYLDR
eukprot:UN10382